MSETVYQKIDRLERELEALKKDKERLDMLAAMQVTAVSTDGRMTISNSYGDLRGMLDTAAAMRKESE